VEDREALDEADLYTAWRAETLTWLHRHFGQTLGSVVEHADEDFLHLHAYAVPVLGPGGHLLLEAVHPGRAALKKAEATGADKAEQRSAYKDAMRLLQDDFYAAVSSRYGHARAGPRRARLEGTEYLLRRDAERREVERARAYDEAEAQLRGDLEAEVIGRFGSALKEARRRAEALAQARQGDHAQIAELLVQNAALLDQLRDITDELGRGYSR
jgi:hypothetical protein